MNVYQVSDVEWVAAESLAEALEYYRDEMDGVVHEGFPVRMTSKDLDTLIFLELDDEDRKTFREELDRAIADKDEFPMLMTTSES